tara:strand:+ start:1992 stop:2939 length:948 start_codon:yes stop_codon:yes gene_type:complete
VRNNLHAFLGATVADAAARPLHWVYDQKKLLRYIRNKKDFTFLKKNKSPFYNIRTGKVSGYNDIGQVMFETLLEGHEKIESRFKKKILVNFGPKSNYWKNLKLRKKYKKVKNWRSLVKGPWIHQNIIEAIENIKSNKKFTGGKKVNESDGYCAALPYFLFGYPFKNIENIIKIITTSKISIKYALTKFYILDFALKGVKNPINEFVINFKRNSYFKSVIKEIEKVKKIKRMPHRKAVKKLGMACSYPGTFNSSIHSILNSKNYKSAILMTIKAGGCNCSRVNFIGAYFAALNGVNSIPKKWINKTERAKRIIKQS